MASTKLSIANSALVNLGANRLVDIDDGSKAGDLCSGNIDEAIDYVLREHPWKTAIKRVKLVASLTPVTDRYAFTYPFPSDYLRAVANDEDLINFQIEGNNCLSNDSNVELRYIWRVNNFNILDSHLLTAIAWYLSKKIAFSLTQNSAVMEMANKQYDKTLARAKFIDASTNRALKQKQDYFLEARLQGNHL